MSLERLHLDIHFSFKGREPVLSTTSTKNVLMGGLAVGLSLALYGCGGGSTITSDPQGETQARQSDISIADSQPGVTPFISSVRIAGQSDSHVISCTYTISSMENSVSKPVSVTWSGAALSGPGYLQAGLISLPVFGLYAGYQKQLSLQLSFD